MGRSSEYGRTDRPTDGWTGYEVVCMRLKSKERQINGHSIWTKKRHEAKCCETGSEVLTIVKIVLSLRRVVVASLLKCLPECDGKTS